MFGWLALRGHKCYGRSFRTRYGYLGWTGNGEGGRFEEGPICAGSLEGGGGIGRGVARGDCGGEWGWQKEEEEG